MSLRITIVSRRLTELADYALLAPFLLFAISALLLAAILNFIYCRISYRSPFTIFDKDVRIPLLSLYRIYI